MLKNYEEMQQHPVHIQRSHNNISTIAGVNAKNKKCTKESKTKKKKK